MGRPPLDIGTYGAIRCYQSESGWRAQTNYRDYDGHTRPVQRRGKTKAEAERKLKKALAERKAPAGDGLTPDSRFKEAAALWFGKFQALADAGKRSPGSVDTYRSILDRHVLPGLGELRIREMTVARIDAFLQALWRSVSVGPIGALGGAEDRGEGQGARHQPGSRDGSAGGWAEEESAGAHAGRTALVARNAGVG
ncbi:hypothetical protein ABZ345_04415 [Lentzea sp. NPDC005914]|uniref:hypothetical protein n=1 Tax=Lentzea sp. NPDC005914 TaxID=3154572 RepID=UPI00340C1F06